MLTKKQAINAIDLLIKWKYENRDSITNEAHGKWDIAFAGLRFIVTGIDRVNLAQIEEENDKYKKDNVARRVRFQKRMGQNRQAHKKAFPSMVKS